MVRKISSKIYAIVTFLILLFAIDYGLLAFFLHEQDILANQMLEMSQTEKEMHLLSGLFYEISFWERKVLDEKNPEAIANYGTTISIIKTKLKELQNLEINESIQSKLNLIQSGVLKHEKIFNETLQLKTTLNLHRTSLNTGYRSLISNILNNDMKQLFKPLFNLTQFFIGYFMQQDEPVYQSLIIGTDYLGKRIEQLHPSDERTKSYLASFKKLLQDDYKFAIQIDKVQGQFEFINNHLVEQFDDVFMESSDLFKSKYSEAETKRFRLNNTALFLTVISVSVLIIIFFMFAKTIVTPIRSLAAVMRNVKEGNIDARFNWMGNKKDEVIEYGYHFNAMLDTLQENEALLRTLVETIPDLVWLKNPEGKYLLCNLKFERFFGAKQKDIIKKTAYDFLDKDLADVFREQDKAAMAANKPCVNEEEIVYADDGHKELIETIRAPVFNSEGNLKGILGIARDITERKKNEEERIEAHLALEKHRKLALVGKISGKMAHDFNNILGIIMGQSELALATCKESEAIKKFQLIFDQTLRGRNLTKNLVVFAKDQEPRQEYFFLNEKINLVLSLLKKDLKGIKIIKEGLSDKIELLADPGMIEHSIVNIILNSIHALSQTENPFISIQSRQSSETIIIEIEDNGCGIPGKHIDEIFEPSFTLKGSRDITSSYESSIKGTGYGMANVKKYVELHRGNIIVNSKVNSGTTVELSFPLIEKKLTEKEKDHIKNSRTYSFKSILLVEDETSISEVQHSILTHPPCNHVVDIVHNGKTAKKFLNDYDYDLISLDYILPGKINGKDLYDYIRSKNKTVPILFISGNIEFLESIKDLKIQDPFLEHISKPCRNIDYINSINYLFTKTGV